MSFNDMLVADAKAMVAAEFSEPGTYAPGDGGTPRAIAVIVFREGLKPMPGEAKAAYAAHSVAVANDAAQGIAASELKRRDRIAVADYPGGPPVSRAINVDTKKIDAGMLILDLI